MGNKGIIKKIIAVCLFLCLLIFVLSRVYKIVRWKDTTGDYLSSVDQLYNTESGLIDAVFVGSSHVYCGIFPCIMWEKYGISGFDMSVSGQDKISAIHHIKELLKTQSPKVILIDMYALTYTKGDVEGNYYRNAISMKTSLNSLSHVDEFCEKEEKVDYIIRWPIVHTRYRELQRYDFVDYVPNNYCRGEGIYFHIDSAVSEPSVAEDDEFAPGTLSTDNIEWLDSLRKLSEEHDFKLVFAVLPYQADATAQAIMDAAGVYAEDNGIDFIDFNRKAKDIGLDYSKDFSDSFHLNGYGAYVLSDYLADYLYEKFDLVGHKGDEAYYQWDLDLKYYYHLLETEKLKSESTPASFVTRMERLDETCYTVITYEYPGEERNKDIEKVLKKIGIEESEIATGGTWIYSAGNVTRIGANDVNEKPVIVRFNKRDSVEVKYNGFASPGNVRINSVEYSNRGANLGFLVYDNLIGEETVYRVY